MSDLFSVTILNAMSHSRKTKEILAPYAEKRKQSKFIRESILSFAQDMGFECLDIDTEKKPEYIPTEVWHKVIEAHKKSYYVDYNYVIAFYWLLSLVNFEKHNKSRLMRVIISHQ
jgi:hypothetical protein